MWTFRNELEPRWDYLKAYEHGLIPNTKTWDRQHQEEHHVASLQIEDLLQTN